MTRRRKARRPTERHLIRSLQLVRLKGLPAGEYEPLSNREALYLRMVHAGLPIDMEDFVVSRPLFLLETAERGVEAENDAGPDTT